MPARTHVPLFVKVLTFDRQLRASGGDTLVVAVAFQGGNAASIRARDEALRLFAAERDAVEGLTLHAVAVDLDLGTLAEALQEPGMRALYVPQLRGIDITWVAATARAANVTTLTPVASYVVRGLAVGVRLQRDRPRLLINATAARLEGADFSSELLRLAVVTP